MSGLPGAVLDGKVSDYEWTVSGVCGRSGWIPRCEVVGLFRCRADMAERTGNMKPAAVSLQAGDDFPRTDVSWYEAVAFCRWLTEKALILHPSGTSDHWEIRLPSEQEWQRAAQGNDGREYPWGNRFDKARANTFESGIGAATPVTRFTGGASPFGVMDMCGNVWEWCLTDLNTGSRDTSVNGPRMLRGACCPPAYLPRH